MSNIIFFALIVSLPTLLSAGCPGCGGFSGQSGSTALGIIGSLSSGMGDPGNFITLTTSTGTYGGEDTTKVLLGFKMNLNNWIGLHFAGTWVDNDGDFTPQFGSPRHYSTSGVGDAALAATFDLTGRTRYTPCPVDGNFLPIKDFYHVMLLTGVSLPVGKYSYEDAWGLYPSEYQLGTGTWDPFAGVALFKRWGRWQPQATILYKWSGRTNDAGYRRYYSFMSRLDLIYFFNPVKKTTLNLSITHSRTGHNERNYNWGPPGYDYYLEIGGTEGNTILGSISFGTEILSKFRINLSYTTSIREPDTGDYSGKSIGDQYSVGVGYRFGE